MKRDIEHEEWLMKNIKEEIKSYGLLFAVLRGIWGILKSHGGN